MDGTALEASSELLRDGPLGSTCSHTEQLKRAPKERTKSGCDGAEDAPLQMHTPDALLGTNSFII